ncbi:MAG: hypothetical protein ACP5N7_05890 [Candidatus Pacearchaeota archaeon]
MSNLKQIIEQGEIEFNNEFDDYSGEYEGNIDVPIKFIKSHISQREQAILKALLEEVEKIKRARSHLYDQEGLEEVTSLIKEALDIK